MKPFIEVKNVKKVFRMGKEKVYALNGINLNIYKNETVCLLGTSGSGKSTLLNMMAGLDKPTTGDVYIGGIHINTLTEDQVTKFRKLNVGFVFQSYNLIPNLTALENVALGLIFKGIDRKKREKMAKKILIDVGLGTRLNHKPNEMSGGQQQRVSIARAFVDSPKIIFADEPTGNLDTRTSIEVMDMMVSMAKAHNQTLIIVTHDEETSMYAQKIVELKDGKIIEERKNDYISSIKKIHQEEQIFTKEEINLKEDLGNEEKN